MPLIKYMQYITYPDEVPVANMPLAVTRAGGNILVPTFSDKAGTVPLANPVMSDSDGLVTFYAPPDNFTTDLVGSLFHYVVDPTEVDDACPGTYLYEQVVPAAVWNITHHYGVRVAVTVIVAGQPVEVEVLHPDDHSVTLTFGNPTAGTAYLRR